MLLTNPYFTALLIPTALLFCGSLAKKLVQHKSWRREYFYMGVEFTLAALSSALLYIFEIAKDLTQVNTASSISPDKKLALTASFISIAVCSLLVVLAIHQDNEGNNKTRREQIFWLCIISNLIGAGLIAGFVVFVKGVQP